MFVTEYRCVLTKDRTLRCSENVRTVHNSLDAVPIARASIVDSPVERLVVLGLNARNRVVGTSIVGQGGISSVQTDVPSVLRPILLMGASGFILAHNHPSGDPEPSMEDVSFTRKVRAGAEVLGLELVDHIVITEFRHVSMLDRNLIFGKEWMEKSP